MRPPDDFGLLGGGRYELLDPLGSGGVSAVFLARDLYGDRSCAVKVLLSHAATKVRARSRFLQEAHTTSHLRHPNIVRVHEIGAEAAPYYYVMELAAGSLANHARLRGPFEPAVSLGFVFQILGALDHAHRAGVIHRDVKPHNVLVMPDGDLRLTDFGIAKWIDGPPLTQPGDALGTLAYMAPEQRADPRNAGPRSDLYGVGATLYHLVTRRRPIDVLLLPTDPSILEWIPEPVRPIVVRSTAPRAEDRYPSARAMAEAVADAWSSVDPTRSSTERMEGFGGDDPLIPRQPPPGSEGEPG